MAFGIGRITSLGRRTSSWLKGRGPAPWHSASGDYREFLFEDLLACLGENRPARILEIGPRDGQDSVRLLTLDPAGLTLVELPHKRLTVDAWVGELNEPRIELIYGNLMYDPAFRDLEPFDLVWCTGVLYHNPEQLRMIRLLFSLTRPEGHLVLESATARRRRCLREENCVEIWYPPRDEVTFRYRASQNVTHLPSRRAIESWMSMVGYVDIRRSDCHRRLYPKLGRVRAAYICRRPTDSMEGTYYDQYEDSPYVIGDSL